MQTTVAAVCFWTLLLSLSAPAQLLESQPLAKPSHALFHCGHHIWLCLPPLALPAGRWCAEQKALGVEVLVDFRRMNAVADTTDF